MTWTLTLPVISTGHISWETCRRLSNNEADPIPGVMIVAEYPEGFFIRFEDVAPENQPRDLAAVRSWVFANHKEGWVRLDAMGDEVIGLPQYNW